jgi:hypothetical protein
MSAWIRERASLARNLPWFRLAQAAGGMLIGLVLAVFVLELPDEYGDLYWGMETVRLNGLFGQSRRFWTVALLLEQYATAIVALPIGLLIFVKRVLPAHLKDWTALLVSVALALLILIPLGAPEFIRYPLTGFERLRTGAYDLLLSLLILLLIHLLYIFPDGRFVPAWTRRVILGFDLVWLSTGLLTWIGWSSDLLWLPTILVTLLSVSVGFTAQVYRYRRVSTPTQRQQTKWVLLSLAMIPAYGVFLSLRFSLESGAFTRVLFFLERTLAFLFAVLIPLAIGVSILRYRLWDIDLIVRRTLLYTTLTTTLAVIYLSSVVLLQAVFSALGGEPSAAVTVLSTLMIAALFNPLRKRLQEGIDRRFFRRKYDAEQALARFAAAARSGLDLDELTAHLAAIVTETVQPEHVSVWLAGSKGRSKSRWEVAEPANRSEQPIKP